MNTQAKNKNAAFKAYFLSIATFFEEKILKIIVIEAFKKVIIKGIKIIFVISNSV